MILNDNILSLLSILILPLCSLIISWAIENKPKIFNHFDQNGKRFFDLESPTPKFFVFEKESKEIRKDSLKSPEEKKENEITRVTRKPTKSSCSLISMSSIIVINKNQEVKEQEQDKPINRY